MFPRCVPKSPGQCQISTTKISSMSVFHVIPTCRRTLKPKGVFVVVSYGIPDNRLSYLEVKDYGWTVTVKTVPKPTVSAASVPDTKDATSVHYVYIMQKSGSSDS